MSRKIVLNVGRWRLCWIRNPRVRFGITCRHAGIPHVGVFTYLRRTRRAGARQFNLRIGPEYKETMN